MNGWQFGDGFESTDDKVLDENDINGLYKVLLEEVIPTYYEKRDQWIEMMKQSILTTKDTFSVKRMLEEYYSKMYVK